MGGLAMVGDEVGLVEDVTSVGARGALLQACCVLTIVALLVLEGQVGRVRLSPLVVLAIGE